MVNWNFLLMHIAHVIGNIKVNEHKTWNSFKNSKKLDLREGSDFSKWCHCNLLQISKKLHWKITYTTDEHTKHNQI